MQDQILAAASCRPMTGGPSFSFGNRIRRLIWNISWILLIAWTPPSFRKWRSLVYRLFGAKLSANVNIRSSARIWAPWQLTMGMHSTLGPRSICYNLAHVTLGDEVVVSQGAHLCAGSHDIEDVNFQLVAAPIVLGSRCWVAAEAFVGPGVTIGEGAVLGARGVAFRDLECWTVFVGNPARAVRQRKQSKSERNCHGEMP